MADGNSSSQDDTDTMSQAQISFMEWVVNILNSMEEEVVCVMMFSVINAMSYLITKQDEAEDIIETSIDFLNQQLAAMQSSNSGYKH